MTDRAKFEQMLEFLINEDKQKAEELFHELIVAKSREIYENLLDDDIQVDTEVEETSDFDLEEVGGDPADDMMSDLEADDEGEEEMSDEEGSEEPATKDDVMDIKDALEDLKAEFEKMLAGEEAEEEEFPGIHGDDETEEEPKEDFAFETDEEDEEDEEGEEMVREYVEKVAAPKGGDNGANAKSVVASKNDMGGTAANITKGSAEEKGGKAPATKDLASGNVNVPGSKTATKLSPAKAAGGDDGANKKSTLGA